MKKVKLILLLFSLSVAACKKNTPPDIERILAFTSNYSELKKVIDHYSEPKDSLKLSAAYFLIKNMDDQYHFEGESIKEYQRLSQVLQSYEKRDSISPNYAWYLLQPDEKMISNANVDTIRDINVITSAFLIKNIDLAFECWRYPWARRLRFDQFCKYILPYKLKNERIDNWRETMQKDYKWVLDSLKGKNDIRAVATLINNDLRKKFYIIPAFNYRWNLNATEILNIKIGRCSEATQLAAYAMRSMGIPATLDFTPNWANKGGGHDWNCLLNNDKNIVFMGAETNPGFEKIESSGYNFTGTMGLKRLRAKIYRYSYEKQVSLINTGGTGSGVPSFFLNKHLEDVTREFVPVSNLRFQLTEDKNPGMPGFAYISIFNSGKWKPIHWSKIDKNNQVVFENMGRKIVYLPVVYKNNEYTPIDDPVILNPDGSVRTLHANTKKLTAIIIYRKYPEDESNKILTGNNYEVFYWDKTWVSMGKQLADTNYLVYKNAPENALFFVQNLDTGFQERIFTVENGIQVWW